MILTFTETFAVGFLGSLAVEVVTVINVYQKEPILFPGRYKKPFFWIARLLLAAIGGGLAVAYDINTPLLAANIGASAPLITNALSQGFQPTLADHKPKQV